MNTFLTIRMVQAAGRRRRCVFARSHGTDFRRVLGADGSVLCAGFASQFFNPRQIGCSSSSNRAGRAGKELSFVGQVEITEAARACHR